MDEATKGLVVAVKETLKDFTAGRLSAEECRLRYRKLAADCEYMERDTVRSTGMLKSTCYAHSTGNFALFTGIFRMDRGELTPLSHCGDDGFSETIARLRDTIFPRLDREKTLTMPPGDSHSFPHTLYACIVPGESRIHLLFTAVSSSHFFSETEFRNTANILGALQDAADHEMRPQYFSFFAERRAAVDAWITARLNEGLPVDAHYFLFNMVERIFSHMGLPEMLKISASIKDTLHRQCGGDGSVVFELSMREYLVFIPDPAGAVCEKKKASFNYSGSAIPSQSYAFAIRKAGDIVDFWNEILEFERLLVTGEKKK